MSSYGLSCINNISLRSHYNIDHRGISIIQNMYLVCLQGAYSTQVCRNIRRRWRPGLQLYLCKSGQGQYLFGLNLCRNILYFKNTQETNLILNIEIIIPKTLSFHFTFIPLLSPNRPPFDLTLLLAVIGVILTTIRFYSQKFTVPIAMKPLYAVFLSLAQLLIWQTPLPLNLDCYLSSC
jgi:hypothetical protein